MLKLKLPFAFSVLITSLALVFGLIGWLHGISPFRAAQATGLIDDSLVDFEGGSGSCFVAQSPTVAPASYGVILSPTVGSNFTGTVLPSGWYTNFLGTVAIGDGVLVVDNGTAYPGPVPLPAYLYSPSRTLEFSATFVAGGGRQFAGFGTQTFDTAGPWAIFSSVDGGDLVARTNNSSTLNVGTTVLAAPGYFGVPHDFRIDWGISDVIYSIDGTAVLTQAAVFGGVQMRPQFHDDALGGGSLLVDWARMSDYAPSPCTYTSRVIDTGIDGTTLTGISTTLNTPAGTAISFEVLTSTDNITWGAWTAVNPDGTFTSSTARYLRYRAQLSTSDPLVTPELVSVRVRGFGPPPTAVQVTALSASGSGFGSREALLVIIGGVMVLGGVSVVFRRRRTAS